MKRFGTLSLLIAVILSACEVVELDDPQTSPNPNDDLIGSQVVVAKDSIELAQAISGDNAKTWTTQAFTLAGSTRFTSCRLDDIMTFSSDGTYQFDGGNELCGAEDDQRLRSGHWEVNYDDLMVIFDKGEPHEYHTKVVGLANEQLTLVGSYTGLEVRGLFSVSN